MTYFCTTEDLEYLMQMAIPADKILSAELAIKSATEAIRNYCDQTISAVTDEAITLDGNGKTRLFLPELPVTGITSIEVDSESLTVDTDYKLGQYGVLYRMSGYVWTEGIQNIDIVYSHGYETIPDDIVSVCVRAAVRLYQAGLKSEALNGISVQSVGIGDYSVTYGQENFREDGIRPLLLSEKDLLNRYRLVYQ